MANNGQETFVSRIPKCDVHNYEHDALYDATVFIPGYGKRWANVCQQAFDDGGGSLGVGRGQRLLLIDTEE